MSEVTLVASLTNPPSTDGVGPSALPGCVKWLEVRSDLLGDLNPEWLRNHFQGQLLYSLRSKTEGGYFSDSLTQRHNRLAAAARSYDLIELEGNRDLTPELLSEIPVNKRVISWHGPATDLARLTAQFRQLSSVPARTYKLVSTAKRISDELIPLCLLKSLNRSDTIAFSVGLLGFWSRLIAIHLGAPAIFGLVPAGRTVAMEPTVSKLIEDYGLPVLRRPKAIYGIVGNPVFQSLSPHLHNAAYRALDYPALFLPFQVESFAEFWNDIVQSGVLDSIGFPINGITVVSPHKEAALQTTKMVSPMARQAESVNILVRSNGWWKADTTDPEVVSIASNDRSIELKSKRIAVIGCGGAGRAIAAALNQSGAGVTLVNRGIERGHHAASLLSLPYRPLLGFNAEGYDILINATPVGRDDDEVPFRVENLDEEAVVIDLAYGTRPTPLVAKSQACERVTIDGREVLLGQVLRQFQMMTGRVMPISLMRKRLGFRVESKFNFFTSVPNASLLGQKDSAMATMNFTRAEDQLIEEHGPVSGGPVDPSPLAGTWLNTDKKTRGIAKLVLTHDDRDLRVRAFGACDPSPCDWGEVQGSAFSSGVSSSEGMAFTALYDFGFMETFLAVYLKGGILVLDSFNTFRDDSGRADYFSREFFHS